MMAESRSGLRTEVLREKLMENKLFRSLRAPEARFHSFIITLLLLLFSSLSLTPSNVSFVSILDFISFATLAFDRCNGFFVYF